MFLQLLANGIIMGAIYALVSLGFALVYNTTHILHIAYATIYMFAPYMLFSFYSQLGLPFLLAFFISIFLTVLLNLVIELFIYRPIKNKSQNIILMSSLGVMIIIVNIIAMFYGNETKIINPDISKSITIGTIILTYTQIYQFAVSIAVISLFLFFLKYSRFGIKTRALRDSETLYKVLGMNVNKMRIGLFALSAIFAAIGSNLVAYDVGMDPYVGMPMFLNAVVALIVGGIGRFEAPILGGFTIGILQSLAIWKFSARWQDVVTFLLLILFLLFRPQGILGEKERRV